VIEFHEKIKQAHGDKAAAEMNFLEEHPQWFRLHFRPAIEQPDFPSVLAFYVAAHMNAALARASTLVGGFISAINERNVLVAILIGRAHSETVGSLATVYLELKRLQARPNDFKQATAALLHLMCGTKLKVHDGLPVMEPLNVMKLIDDAERAARDVGLGELGLREMYEHRCEYTHPNCAGLNLGLESREAFSGKYEYPLVSAELELAEIKGMFASDALARRLVEGVEAWIVSDGAKYPSYLS